MRDRAVRMAVVLATALIFAVLGARSRTARASCIDSTTSGPVILVTPDSLDFGDQQYSTSSRPRTIFITNVGTAPLVITNLSVNALPLNIARSFPISPSSVPKPLGPGESEPIRVEFVPSTVGEFHATLIITDNAPGSPHRVPLAGIGTNPPPGPPSELPPGSEPGDQSSPEAAVGPSPLDFSSVEVGASATRNAIVFNLNDRVPLEVYPPFTIGGANAGDFHIPGASGKIIVPVGGQYNIPVSFTPSALGPRTASMHVSTNSVASAFVVRLTGNGAPPCPPLLTVGQPVAHTTGLEFFEANPPPPESTDITLLRGVAPDGSLLMVDWAGAALLRIPQTSANLPAQILVDPSRPPTSDGVGIARLLRAEVSRGGAAALLALRADNNRGIYRLDRPDSNTLTLLGLLAGPRGTRELAIGDAGQTAYVADVAPNNPTSPLALFQAGNGAPKELLRQGQAVVNGATATIQSFSDLTGNGNGDLSLRVALNGAPAQAVLRITSAGLEVVAKSGDIVERGRGTGVTGVLVELRRPLIGPDGSVVFLGAGSDFVNFYVARPGRPPEALLGVPGTDTSIVNPDLPPSPSSGRRFDYEIAADGTIALQAALVTPTDSMLLLVSPTGSVTAVVAGQRTVEPILRPVFGPGGAVLFLAENEEQPPDRDGRFQVGLYRFRPGGTALEPLAMPGDHVPTWSSDTRVLGFTQRPVVAGDSLFFGMVFGGPENFPVPTAALFKVPMNGKLADGLPIVPEGYPETDASRLALLRNLSYRADQSLVAYGLMPGAGPLIAPASNPVGIASRFRTQAAPPASITPLVALGDLLGSGRLESIEPPLVSVGADRELFGARTSQVGLPDHEGLFTVGRMLPELVAMNRDAVRDRAGTFFDGFADTRYAENRGLPDTRTFTLSPSSVSPDGRVVFKSLLDRGGVFPADQIPPFGILQWSSGGVPSTVGLSDDLLVAGDPLPYVLDHWAAGPGGLSYLQARAESGHGKARLFVSMAGGKPTPLVGPGTPVQGGTPLADVTDFVLNRSGDLFVAGITASGAGVFRWAGGQLMPVALQGRQVPPFTDGSSTAGFAFTSSFQLLPSTTRGPRLIFRAMVQKPGGAVRLGEFQWSLDRNLETRSIVGIGVSGERSLGLSMLGDTTAEIQNGNGTAVSAYMDDHGGWVIVRERVSNGSILREPIAQDMNGKDPTARRFMALNAGPLLDREGLPPHDGPMFTLNDAGEVALLASDGSHWGIYSIAAP